MTGIWSTIKAAAPPPLISQQHESSSSSSIISSSRGPPSPPRVQALGSPSSRSLPRTAKSVDSGGSQRATAPQPRSPGAKGPSGPSRSSITTAAAPTERCRDKDGEAGLEDARGDAGTSSTTAIAGSANGTTDTVHVAPAVPAHAHAPTTPSPGIDPLSQHIFIMRKNTDTSIPQRLTQMAEGRARTSLDSAARNAPPVRDGYSHRRRGSAFLSRLSIRGGRKKALGDLDSDSELGSEARMDGIDARVFSQSFAGPLVGGGYVPHHKEPPRYIRTKASNKRTREFNRMFLAQELVGTRPPAADGKPTSNSSQSPVVAVSVAGASDRKPARTGGAIWATEFSKDGKFLASAGRDHVVRVWAVISTPEERRAHEEDEAASRGTGERLSAPVFREQPAMEFRGHTGEILDLSWSKNNFLLSSSMDKTVRLWHLSRPECLCTFRHKDFVTRLVFHPRDDRFFLAGSLDTMLRLWSIPDKAVAYSAQLPDLVTAVAFSPDGNAAIAGLVNGLCLFYETEGLKLSTQIHVRSSRGKNAKGSKITGIQTMAIPQPPSQARPGSASTYCTSADFSGSGEVRVLVTSNDSRIRIYSLRDKSIHVKLKGHENVCSQIAARFSDDGKYVICGSEDHKTFIWSLTGSDAVVQDKHKAPCEYFVAHGQVVTTAVFAPTKTRMLLGQSGDPIYDLCNPPPVVLRSLEEAASAAASQVTIDSQAASSSAPAPAPAELLPKRPEPSPAYIARSTHYDGHIIVTTDDTGIIKVFRQDCAFAKRRHDSWETGSGTFSRKHSSGGSLGGGLGRSLSVLTRASHTKSRSVSQAVAAPPGGSIGSPARLAHPDRILSWRQGIENGSDRRFAVTTMANGGGGGTPARSERSLSPAKASQASLRSADLASEARKQQQAAYSSSGPSLARHWAGSTVTSPTTSLFSNPPDAARGSTRLAKDKDRPKEKKQSDNKQEEPPSVPPTPGFTLRRATEDGQSPPPPPPPPPDSAGGGLSFWNLGRWCSITGFRAASSSSGQGPLGGGSRNRTDGSCSADERDVDRAGATDRETASRRQSVGVLPDGGPSSRGAADSDWRKSLPPASSTVRGRSNSDAPSVPVDVGGGAEEEEAAEPGNAVRVVTGGDGPLPFRRGGWRRGRSHVSGLGADLGGGRVLEERQAGGAEEMACRNCGGKEFVARRHAGKQTLSCARCGEPADGR